MVLIPIWVTLLFLTIAQLKMLFHVLSIMMKSGMMALLGIPLKSKCLNYGSSNAIRAKTKESFNCDIKSGAIFTVPVLFLWKMQIG